MNVFNGARSLSPGLALLLSANAAFPSAAGDRNRTAAMDAVLESAIGCKARFDIDDGRRIEDARLEIRSCVGVFRPLDSRWYHLAARTGGTYARMWERHHGFKPFLAPEAFSADRSHKGPLARQRIVPHVGILLPEDEPEAGLQVKDGAALWWCTNLDRCKDRVLLCRYLSGGPWAPWQAFEERLRRPVRRKTVLRSQWSEFAQGIVLQRALESSGDLRAPARGVG